MFEKFDTLVTLRFTGCTRGNTDTGSYSALLRDSYSCRRDRTQRKSCHTRNFGTRDTLGQCESEQITLDIFDIIQGCKGTPEFAPSAQKPLVSFASSSVATGSPLASRIP
jgi:hypothetical protein